MNKNDNPWTPKEFDVLFHEELVAGTNADTIIAMIAVGFKHNILLNSMDVYLNKTLAKYPHNVDVLLFLCHYYLNQICEDRFPYELEDIRKIHTDPARKQALDHLTKNVSEAIIQYPHESGFLYLKAATHFWNEDFVSSNLIMCYLLQQREETEESFYSLCAYSFFHLKEYNQVIQICLFEKGERVNEIPLSYILLVKSWIAIRDFNLAIKLTDTLIKDFDAVQNRIETARIDSIEKKSLLRGLDACKQIVVDLIKLCNSKQQEQENQPIYEQILNLINKRNLEEAQEKLDSYNKLLVSLGEVLDIEAKIKVMYLRALIKYKQKKYLEIISDIDTFFLDESSKLSTLEYDRYFEITKDLFKVLISALLTQKGTDNIVAGLIKVIRPSFASNQDDLIKWTEMFCKSAIKIHWYKDVLAVLNTEDIWKASPCLQSAYIKVNIETRDYDAAEQTCDYIKSLFGAAFTEYLYFKSAIAHERKDYTLALAYVESYIHSQGQDKETTNLKESIVEKLAKNK